LILPVFSLGLVPALLLGLGLSMLVAALAYWRGSLTSSGALGALVVGTVIFAMGGLGWGLLLVAFFVTSSVLSHYQERAKEPLAEKFQKGHRRDIGQVLANGSWGALMALTFGFYPHPVFFAAFAGAMATVNADTWATELGVLSKIAPRLITNGRVVVVGTSGGVTPFGTFVAFLGALLIGALASLFVLLAPDPLLRVARSRDLLLFPLVITAAGLLGSLFDSLLGATVQAIYFCDFDQKETESAQHRCGRATRLVRGWRWLDNDWVNFLASVLGSLFAVALFQVTIPL
jgi:uncharacterized protein (TIGR00297 family)